MIVSSEHSDRGRDKTTETHKYALLMFPHVDAHTDAHTHGRAGTQSLERSSTFSLNPTSH